MRVQCQITHRYLGDGCRRAGGIWICRYCPEGETYQRAELFDPELCDLVDHAIERARAIFEKPDDDLETRIWLGDHPETVYEEAEGAVHIYLGRDSNWLQYAYSGAHEAFHRACSPCNGTRSWADEMLAVMFSLRYLHEVGLVDHAQVNEVGLRQKATQCTLEQAMNHRGRYPDGFYGRVFLVGEALIEAVGWDALGRLAAYYDADGIPEVPTWIDSLPATAQAHVKAILTP
jgi:hypothetical protein